MVCRGRVRQGGDRREREGNSEVFAAGDGEVMAGRERRDGDVAGCAKNRRKSSRVRPGRPAAGISSLTRIDPFDQFEQFEQYDQGDHRGRVRRASARRSSRAATARAASRRLAEMSLVTCRCGAGLYSCSRTRHNIVFYGCVPCPKIRHHRGRGPLRPAEKRSAAGDGASALHRIACCAAVHALLCTAPVHDMRVM